jgi:NADH-quinone oxidoreductase subunit G
MTDSVKVVIDGVEVEVAKGTLVIRAAELIGRYIPRFCDHPLLDPLGACRQCLVEIEGQRKPLTACTTTCTDGMVVRTQFESEIARDAQEGVLELLLINHPLDCPMCDKGGECPLQDQALAYGPGGSRYVDPKRRFTKPVPVSPLVKLDRERCVLCARCTRFADQIAGDPFIELFERGALEQVAIFEDEPYSSAFSGNVIQICPVGALTSSTFRFLARPFDMTATASTCTRCASGCATNVQERRGQLARVLAREDLTTNDEWLCDKGRFAYPYAAVPERVTEPLVRKKGDFVAVSWAEAIEAVANAVRDAGEKPHAVLAGGNLLDEDAYALGRFARTVLRTNDVDARARAGSAEEDAVLQQVARGGGATYADIDAASAVVVVGTDPHEESPIVFLRLRKNARNRGLKVVEVSARRSALRDTGARWVPCVPGAEAAALAALENELSDARGSVVVLAGERLAQSSGALTAAWNLAVALGGRFGWLPRKGGARGAVNNGVHPALLPGGRSVRWAPQREEVERVWGVPLSQDAGADAGAMLASPQKYGTVWLAGADPVRDFAGEHVARDLEAAQFVVSLDMFLTESTKRAHVVLPVTSAYEREGTITGWDGVARDVRGAIAPAGLARSDFEILAQIAQALGVKFPARIDALRKEMREFVPAPHAAERIEGPGAAAAARPGGELTLDTLRVLLDDGTMMAGADALAQTAPDPVVELNTEDAAARGVANGDLVEIAFDSGRGGTLRARVTDGIARGAVWLPAQTGRALRALGHAVTIKKAES